MPLEKTLGPKIGAYVKSLHESKGVQFVINAEVSAFSSKSGEHSGEFDVHNVHLNQGFYRENCN